MNKLGKWLLHILFVCIPVQAFLYFFSYTPAASIIGEWQQGKVGVYGLDLVALMLLLVSVAHWRKKFFLCAIQSPTCVFSLFLAGLMGVSLFWVSWPIPVLLGMITLVIYGLTPTYIRLYRIPIKTLLILLICGGVLASGLAFIQFALQHTLQSSWLGTTGVSGAVLGASVVEGVGFRLLRVYSFFTHPNIAGFFLGFACLAALWYGFITPRFRVWILCANLAMLCALLMTFSRSSWLAFAAGYSATLILTVFRGKKLYISWVLTYGAVACALCGFIFLLWPSPFLVRTVETGTSRLERMSIHERTLSWEILPEEWGSIFGVGAYQSSLSLWERDGRSKHLWDYQPPHSFLLILFFELGWSGLIVTLIFFLYGSYRVASHVLIPFFEPEDYGVLPLFVYTIIASLFDHYLWSYHSGVVLFFASLSLIEIGVLRYCSKDNESKVIA